MITRLCCERSRCGYSDIIVYLIIRSTKFYQIHGRLSFKANVKWQGRAPTNSLNSSRLHYGTASKGKRALLNEPGIDVSQSYGT